MRTRIRSGTCAAIAFGLAVGVLAQEPSQPKPSASAKSITVTGCIQRAEQGPTGTSGTPGASAAANEPKFLLTNAAMGSSGTGTSGTAGSVPSSAAVSSEYRLVAEDAKLTDHVGHKVEISGTVEKASSAATQPPAASAANAPKLKVDTVRMIASTCP